MQQRTITAHPQAHLHVLLYSLIPVAAPGKHWGNRTETRSFSSPCQQGDFLFSTQEALRCHSLTEECLPLLPSAALEARWFQQAADQRIPSQNTDLATPLWFHTARLTSQGNYPTEQHRKSWQEFTLLLKISSFSLTVNSSLPCRFKESSSLTLHSCLTCTILHLTTNSSNTVNSCHAYL